ncbi:MAG: hypothetical protein JO257_20705, partial [Deltaproteobacteria bacterium]|nr:hypothetical protein [Deltaproteobacteria bacterium]
MRWFVVGALAACGTTPVGKVSVTVYSNAAASGDAYVPAKPIAGVMVFEEDGAQATTDAAGVAELAIDHDPATVHVVAGGLVTIVGVPNGGNVRLGNRPYFPAVGLMTIDVDGTNDFAVATPGCLSFHGGAGSGIEVSFDGACAGQTV